MEQDAERAILEPRDEADRAALRCLIRLRAEGKDAAAIAAGLRAETGIDLSPEAVDRVMRQVAGPAAGEEPGNPEFFSGHLGGG